MGQDNIIIINPPRVGGKNVRRDERSADILDGEVSPFYQGAVLAEYLRQNHGKSVSVLDANGLDLSLAQVDDWIIDRGTIDLAIIKAADDTLLEDVKVAALCKQHGMVTMLWEPILTPAEPETIWKIINTEKQIIDYFIMGEAELTVGDFLTEGKGAKGLAYVEQSKLILNARSEEERLVDLESLPIPDFNDLPVDRYMAWFGDQPWMTLFTSRGCSGNCTYCLIGGTSVFRGYGRKVRMQSAKRIIDEVETLVKKHGVRHITFWDDNFTLSRERVVELCELIRSRKLIFDWSCMSRVDTIDEELLVLMKAAGLKRIGFGIESGSQKILDSIPKHVTVEQNADAIRLAKKHGVWVWAFIIMGLPEESWETAKETMAFIRQTKPDYLFLGTSTPFPGTKNYEQCRQLNLLEGDIIKSIIDGTIITGSSVTVSSKYMTAAEIGEAKRLVHRAFVFSSPGIIWRKLKENYNRLGFKYLKDRFYYFFLGR